ncbi:hypothetical protein ACNKHV_00875 [Shigella flexneri]
MKDLKDGVIRLIGNPETRYREDPGTYAARIILPPNWVCASARKPQEANPSPRYPAERYPTGTPV